MGTWKACLWSMWQTYVVNIMRVVFFFFFFFLPNRTLAVLHTRAGWERLFDRETVAVIVIADGIEAELTEHQTEILCQSSRLLHWRRDFGRGLIIQWK